MRKLSVQLPQWEDLKRPYYGKLRLARIRERIALANLLLVIIVVILVHLRERKHR